MSVCNLFKELTKETGTFITFSQYVDDLAQVVGNQPTVNVVPSQFYALNVDYSLVDNTTLMQHFQNNFENLISTAKNRYWDDIVGEESDDSPWENKYDFFTNCFWDRLGSMGWLATSSGHLTNFVYHGTIELVGAKETMADGMTYSEFFCHIPNSAKRSLLTLSVSQTFDPLTMNVDASHPEGWPLEDGQPTMPADTVDYFSSRPGGFPFPDGHQYLTPTHKYEILDDTEDSATAFEFNTIIVLYDIYMMDPVDGTFSLRYTGVPMGIYFTGLIDDGEMTNSVTKYVSSDSIYENGTSYGLRVCSRFVTALDNDKVQNVIIADATNYIDYASVMSAMARTLQKVNELINSVNQSNNKLMDWISQWKNKTVNVPYTQEVSGELYWFVNGKMVAPVYQSGGSSPEPGPDPISR